MKLTAEEIDAGKTVNGGWDRATLAAWGVGWPPPKGWRQMLIDGTPIPEPGVGAEPATAVRPSASPEAAILREVVMAVIESGHGEVLGGVKALNDYYGNQLPTVADVIGGRPANAVFTGGVSFDDKVYSFRCERTLVVQGIEQGSSKPEVAGSNPAERAPVAPSPIGKAEAK